MKKYILMLTIAGLGLSAIAKNPAKKAIGETYKMDIAASTFNWHATKVTGEHKGLVKYSSGTIKLSGSNLAGSEIIMDMTTIDDLDMTGEYHDKLVGHLKSEDFFSVEKNKTATLKVKSSTAIAGAASGTNNYYVVADLSIKGITKEIKFPAMLTVEKGQITVLADFDINRTLYDIKYGSKTFFENIGDKAISDNFNVKVRVIANK